MSFEDDRESTPQVPPGLTPQVLPELTPEFTAKHGESVLDDGFDNGHETPSVSPANANVGSPTSESSISVAASPRQPQFLHYSSIIFDLASHSRELLMPLVFGFVGAASGSWFWGVIAIVAFAFSMLRTLIRYFTLRYEVAAGELVLNEGLIFKNQRIVPLAKIQNIDLMQNVLHRIFRVAEVRLETASGSEAEAVLRVLTETQVAALRQAVFGSRPLARSAAGATHLQNGIPIAAQVLPESQAMTARPDGTAPPLAESAAPGAGSDSAVVPLLKISLAWLIVAGLAGNRGWLMIGVAIGTVYQFDLHERLLPQQWEAWLPVMRWSWTDVLNHWPSLLSLAAVAFLLLKVLGAAWYIYRFYGYQLKRHGSDLQVSAGLISRYSMSVPRQRIQFISIHRPWVLGWFRFVSIRIETAGGAGGGEESRENLARTWFIPVVPASQVPRLLHEIRPGLTLVEDQMQWQGTAVGTRSRLLRLALLISVVAVGLCGYVWGMWGLVPGGLVAAHQVWYALRRSQSLRYARTDFGVVFRSGILYRKLSCTFFDRIQTLRWSQSPFDRRWKMASLVVDTAAAGPADHKIEVPYLDVDFARREFAALERAAAEHRPQWR